ncbi:MAG: AMP-binding protein [Acidimicrobiales bacterium]
MGLRQHTCSTPTAPDRGANSWPRATRSFDEPIIDTDDLACILYTSGTTGRSKGAMITHGNLISNAYALHDVWGFRSDDVLVHALPIFHVHGLFVSLHPSMLSGIPIRFHAKFGAPTIAADLANGTVFMGVPTMYTRLVAEPAFTRETCASIRIFTAGSAPLLPETFAAVEAAIGHQVVERYGMTETGIITSNLFHGQRKVGSVGPSLPGVEVRIADEHDQPVDQGEVGGVQVQGPNVFVGYWQMPEKTEAEFTDDGWFRTGDVGTVDEDGFVNLVGRSKDLVISGGFNVYPKEIELLVDDLDGVDESAVIGVYQPDFGEAVVAVVVALPGASLDTAAMTASLKSELAAFKVPKAIVTVDALPRNTMGKVQKKLLRDEYDYLFRSTT